MNELSLAPFREERTTGTQTLFGTRLVEHGVAFWATLAYSLLEAEAIVGLGDYAIKALVGSDFVVLLKGAGKVDGLVGFLLHDADDFWG